MVVEEERFIASGNWRVESALVAEVPDCTDSMNSIIFFNYFFSPLSFGRFRPSKSKIKSRADAPVWGGRMWWER